MKSFENWSPGVPKALTRLITAAAALGLVAAPIIALANTRAGGSALTDSVSNASPGLGRASGGEEQGEAGSGALLIGAAVVAAILVGSLAGGDDVRVVDDCASPGAC